LEHGISARAASAFESEWVAKSGEPRRISFSNVPMLNAEGEVEYYITTGIDITDRHRADQELLKSENQFRSLWEASCEPMFLTDPSGSIVKVNAAFASMLNTDPGSLEGMNVTGLFPPEEGRSTARIPSRALCLGCQGALSLNASCISCMAGRASSKIR
jgi:PAS domain-containing protein